ncbi:MAG: MarR family transcriptional regulator [Syntrophomonadaceae bacterium]|nr:MarR family transcriptional regulator [Syntrophomonadaceae bacterium]
MEDFAQFIPYRMKMVMKGFEKQGTDYTARYNLSMGQSYILIALIEEDGSPLTRVGQRANLESSTITNMVDRMERDGLVERRPSRLDRRTILLYITDKGREIGKIIYDEACQHNAAIEASLGEYREAWFEIVKRMEKFIADGYQPSK